MNRIRTFESFFESRVDSKTSSEIVDYIKNLTPSDSDVPDYYLKLIKNSRKNFHLETIEIEKLLKNDKSLSEYVRSGEIRYGEEGESDLQPDPDELFNPIVIFNDEVVDGYSRTSTLYHSGEKTIDAWVSE